MSINEIKIEEKTKYLKHLTLQYQEAHKKLKITDNKTRVNEEINQLSDEMDKVNNELENLRNSSKSKNNNYRSCSKNWDEKIPKIDFKKSKNIIKNIITKFQEEEAKEAIFLLQDSYSKEGRFLIQYMKSAIQGEIKECDDTCKFGFLDQQETKKEPFLNFLAEWCQVEFVDNLQCESKIIEGICKKLRDDKFFVFTIDIACIYETNNFLEWFIEFWEKLLARVTEQRKKYSFINLVAVIAVSSSVPQSCLKKSLLCTEDNFDGKKFLELPLHNWEEQDISKWIRENSGLNLESEEIERMARQNCNITKGVPINVYYRLINTMSKHVA